MKKLGSDLVVQRSRHHHFEVVFENYKLGMVSESITRKRKIERKNRVAFGRTEVSISQFRSCLRDLQDGHSFSGIGALAALELGFS